MYSFDLHVHPSIKASLTRASNKKTPWDFIKIKLNILRFHETLNSQSNLTQLTSGKVNLSVNGLSGVEMAYAQSYVLRKLLASKLVSDLDRDLFTKIIKKKYSYFDMFKRDLQEIESSNVRIISKFSEILEDTLNIILSIEGSHSFQDKTPDSIVPNLVEYKKKYRFLYLTLTHLNREPACVHCFGTKIQVFNKDINITPNILFRPDSTKLGISKLGEEIINAAYDKVPYELPIDIKHMSYVSRHQFYQLRRQNGWSHIPLIASHCGVAGSRLSEAKIIRIEDDPRSGCKVILWDQVETESMTTFNPWTISLFDEDIEEIIGSRGLIGISLDQRVIGYGNIYGEYMSPKEVAQLGLVVNSKESNKLLQMPMEEPPVYSNMDPNVLTVLEYESGIPDEISDGEHTYDMLYEYSLDQKSPSLIEIGVSHIDYLSCNALHVLKVGFKKGYDGVDGKPDVRKCLCIGSDLDGMVDSINFPAVVGEVSINKDNWVTAEEYQPLREEFIISFNRCYNNDSYFQSNPVDLTGFTEMFFYTNGYNYLKEHFK